MVTTVSASICWDGPERDIVIVSVEPAIMEWIVDPLEENLNVVLYLEVEDADVPEPKETGRIAGVEIVDFLDFDQWDVLPNLPLLWQLDGWEREPLPLPELLKRLQVQLRARAEKAAGTPSRAAS
jgi:hypothetical protein